MKRMKDMNRYLSDLLLYSCLGCFSYFLLVHFADIPARLQDRLMMFEAFAAVIILFCGVGLTIRWINRKMVVYYHYFLKHHRMLSVGLLFSALILFMSNYLLLVSTKALMDLPEPFSLQRRGFLVIIGVCLIELFIVGQSMLNRFYADLVRLYKHAEELEESTVKARYMALQSQLNPHFLFNSLNTLVSEIEYNPPAAVEFTRNLADVYRYILYCQDKHTVSLEEEMKFVDSYMLLHKVRLGNCLFLDNRIHEIYKDAPVPPLTLQLLVENIIKHNVISLSKPMQIILYTEVEKEGTWLCVKNLVRTKFGVLSSGKGLKNLDQRYWLLYTKNISVINENNEFIVKVPLVYE